MDKENERGTLGNKEADAGRKRRTGRDSGNQRSPERFLRNIYSTKLLHVKLTKIHNK